MHSQFEWWTRMQFEWWGWETISSKVQSYPCNLNGEIIFLGMAREVQTIDV